VLPKKNRLKHKKDFKKVYRLGKSERDKFLVLRTLENNLDSSRFGIIISKKVAKKATVRNLIRRKIREAIRSFLPEVKPGFDIVVFTLQGIENLDFWQIKESLEKVFKKAKLIQKNDYR
jgi:ribonuclease P protein component